MPDELYKNYEEWFRKAEEDEFAGKKILEAKHFLGPACFHFQQMAEKCLKGLLVFYEKEFPKTHDLLRLETLILEIEPRIKKIEKELDMLNRYYIETRYPGDYQEPDFKETQKAFIAASKIKEFVLKIVKS